MLHDHAREKQKEIYGNLHGNHYKPMRYTTATLYAMVEMYFSLFSIAVSVEEKTRERNDTCK